MGPKQTERNTTPSDTSTGGGVYTQRDFKDIYISHYTPLASTNSEKFRILSSRKHSLQKLRLAMHKQTTVKQQRCFVVTA
jgi:hypothetical protein